MSTIRRQMPEDHDPKDCRICQFLAAPCKNCGKLHTSYEVASHCMRVDSASYYQYQQASTIKE